MLTSFDGTWLGASGQAQTNTAKRLVSGLFATIAEWRIRSATREMLSQLDVLTHSFGKGSRQVTSRSPKSFT